MERPRRVVRFARLIQRRVRDLGGPAARAASGGNLTLPWLPLRVASMDAHVAAVLATELLTPPGFSGQSAISWAWPQQLASPLLQWPAVLEGRD